MSIPEKLKSRKFWLALIAALVVFLNRMWDLGLTEQELILVVAPLLAYIGVEGIADIKERK